MNLYEDIAHLTLAEAIEKMRGKHSRLMAGTDKAAQTWFLNHDATHIIFANPPFELKGETLNDLWTLFGSTVTLKEYAEFFKFTSLEKTFRPYVKKHGSKFAIVVSSIKLVPYYFKVFARTRKMTKKWPWHVGDEQLNKTIAELRTEFNIVVLK